MDKKTTLDNHKEIKEWKKKYDWLTNEFDIQSEKKNRLEDELEEMKKENLKLDEKNKMLRQDKEKYIRFYYEMQSNYDALRHTIHILTKQPINEFADCVKDKPSFNPAWAFKNI